MLLNKNLIQLVKVWLAGDRSNFTSAGASLRKSWNQTDYL